MEPVYDNFIRQEDQPVVYVIFHKPTGRYFIGSTDKSSKIIKNDYRLIRAGTHGNKVFNLLGKVVGDYYHTLYPFENKDKARRIKDTLVLLNRFKGKCVNIKAKYNEQSVDEIMEVFAIQADLDEKGRFRYVARNILEDYHTPIPEINLLPPGGVKLPPGLREVEFTTPLINDRSMGVYIIQHRDSGRYYVGSSVKIYQRLVEHLSLLRRKKHANRYIQDAFMSDTSLTLHAYTTDNREEAYVLEQKIINLNRSDSKLLNIAKDVRSIKGVKFKTSSRLRMSESRKTSGAGRPAKRVIVNGIEYESIAEAHRRTGLGVWYIAEHASCPENNEINFVDINPLP